MQLVGFADVASIREATAAGRRAVILVICPT